MALQTKPPRHKRTAADCEVQPSPIHGFGLFTRSALPEGTVILEMEGEVVPASKLADTFIASGHWQGLAPGLCLVSALKTSFAFVNHSKTPTARVELETRRLRAVKPLHSGEEITLDYDLEPMDDRCRRLLGTLKP